MSVSLVGSLERDLADRAAAGLARTRRIVESPQGARVVVDGRELVAFASNDYLGLANHPALIAATRAAAQRFGVGAGASHLVAGANSIFYGDKLLTTGNPEVDADRALLASLGLCATDAPPA